ncbi:MAG TPA: saccharopine dehydrogenase C-terminal domain-containing protein [Ferruginibacter sp.]|nr:saccharopine dehydrogenase C-terminal domain-containing protein [Ferruginibacter sp.]
MKIAILGAGMVGRAMAGDLASRHEVCSFDISNHSLQLLTDKLPSVRTQAFDLMQFDAYPALLAPFDAVISAVPGFMGYRALEAIIRSRKSVADISFFPEHALDLHALAQYMGVTAIVDCGVAPGLSNLVLGYENARLQLTHFDCMVGGLPKKRDFPFEYKAPFSPIDVLEEYTRPARYVENGNVVTRPALSDPELVNLHPVGTLESFNTDGLRSILFTMSHIPNMKEKTLRYPGHIRLIEALKQSGFFGEEPKTIHGQTIRPIDFTASLLFDQWKLSDADEEFTIMEIVVTGKQENNLIRKSYLLYDERCRETGISSMSRTTGYTCTAALEAMLNGRVPQPGVFPPELLGHDEVFTQFIFEYLAARNIRFRIKTESV